MKALKKKFKKILAEPINYHPSKDIERLEKLILELAGEIDKLREEKQDKSKTAYAPVSKVIVESERLPREVIKERMFTIVVDKLGLEESEVTEEASFKDDLGADSLDVVELIMEFEREFNVEIRDEDAEAVVTFGEAVDALYKSVNAKN